MDPWDLTSDSNSPIPRRKQRAAAQGSGSSSVGPLLILGGWAHTVDKYTGCCLQVIGRDPVLQPHVKLQKPNSCFHCWAVGLCWVRHTG